MLCIKDWAARFEAARAKDRPRKAMGWLPLPCDLTSTGYCLLMAERGGAMAFGVFVALCELVASLPLSARSGALLNAQGIALTVEQIAIKTRIHPDEIVEAIGRLKAVGWLAETTGRTGFPEIPGESRIPPEIPGECQRFPEIPREPTILREIPGECLKFPANPGGHGQGHGEGEEEERTHTQTAAPKNGAPCVSPFNAPLEPKHPPRRVNPKARQWFKEFWAAYWRRSGLTMGEEAFHRHVTTPARFAEVMAAVAAQTPEMMERGEERYRPEAASWLDGKRWLDQPEE